VGLTPHHHHVVCRGPRKSTAIPLLTPRTFVIYKRVKPYPHLSVSITYVSHKARLKNVKFEIKRGILNVYTNLLLGIIAERNWPNGITGEQQSKQERLHQKLPPTGYTNQRKQNTETPGGTPRRY